MAMIFTPDETSTPEGLKRRRRYAEALLQQGTDASAVKHWTQALARVLQSGMGGYLSGKVDREEKEAAAYDSGVRAKMLTEALGGRAAASAAPPTPIVAPSKGEAAAPASFAEVAPRLKADLARDFGLNDVQAAAFAGNLAHESGGFNTLQEVSPVVPGSRGGFGYAQWTGPRRREFEAWTARNGLDPTSYEANYGFLKHELANTGEKKVLEALRQTNDPVTATQVVSDQFLRPGVPGMASRQKWTQRALTAGNQADLPAAGATPVAQETGQPGFFVPPASGIQAQPTPAVDIMGNVTGLDEPGAVPPVPEAPPQPLPPVFQSEGVGQPWMGTALPQQAAPQAPPQTASAPLPPTRPADLAMPQADLPAPGAVPAIGQLPPNGLQEDLSNASGAGGRELLVQALMGGQSVPQAATPAPSASASPVAVPAATASAPAPATQAGGISNSALIAALTDQRASPATQQLAMSILSQRIKRDDPLDQESKRLDIETKKKNLGKADSPTVQRIKQPDGSEVAVQWDQQKGAWVPLEAPQGGNPVKAPAKLTEQQSKDVGFYNRGSKIVDRLDQQDTALKDTFSALGGNVSNYLKSDAYRQAEQTGRELLAVILRKDTGAAVTDKEMELYGSIYLPKPGDDDATVAQKRASRRTAIEGLKMGLGPAEILFNSANPPAPPSPPVPPAPPAAPQRPAGQTKSGLKWSVE
jgi:hypothetical protein